MQAWMASPLLVAGALLGAMLVAHEVGYQVGRRRLGVDEDYNRRVDMIRNAILALVTFLVGFSFAAAGSRFIDRQDMIVKEANAIGTSWLRAMLLPEPQRSRLQTLLRDYTADRLKLPQSDGADNVQPLLVRAGQLQQQIWQAGVEGVGKDREFANFMLPPLNDVIDLHSSHLSTARRHIPPPIILMIVVASAFGMALIGYDNGLGRRRYLLLSSTFGVVAAASLWMTIDLDRPRHGLIRASAQPYVELLGSMK